MKATPRSWRSAGHPSTELLSPAIRTELPIRSGEGTKWLWCVRTKLQHVSVRWTAHQTFVCFKHEVVGDFPGQERVGAPHTPYWWAVYTTSHHNFCWWARSCSSQMSVYCVVYLRCAVQ
jgi:hypothetical protein